MNKEEKHLVFVYGTLRKGLWNHGYLLDEEFLDYGTLSGNYTMFASGIPYLKKAADESDISGEIYKVSSKCLERLDRLEGHPRVYKREVVEVTNELGDTVKAWVYFYTLDTSKSWDIVEDGDYVNYVTKKG